MTDHEMAEILEYVGDQLAVADHIVPRQVYGVKRPVAVTAVAAHLAQMRLNHVPVELALRVAKRAIASCAISKPGRGLAGSPGGFASLQDAMIAADYVEARYEFRRWWERWMRNRGVTVDARPTGTGGSEGP